MIEHDEELTPWLKDVPEAAVQPDLFALVIVLDEVEPGGVGRELNVCAKSDEVYVKGAGFDVDLIAL